MGTEEPSGDTLEKEKPLKRFILLPFRLVFKILVALLLIFYVLAGASATKELHQRNLYRSQDMSYLFMHMDEATASGKSKTLISWLRARPLSETDKLIEVVTPKSAGLGHDVFFEFSRRQLALGRTEEALFWLQMVRFRLIYDIIRCGGEPGSEKVFDFAFKNMNTPETDELLRARPELVKKTTQRILDFDAEYPAHNNPAAVCQVITTMLPAEELNWEGYRKLLRAHVDTFMNRPDAAKAMLEKK